MSILIKGMEMPTSEEKCKFYQPVPFRSPYCVINGVCNGLEACPLCPVPPHGRLIDADALGEFPYNMDFCDGYEVDEWVANAPTIIPAEEGE